MEYDKYQAILKEMQQTNKLLRENNELLKFLGKRADEGTKNLKDEIAKIRGRSVRAEVTPTDEVVALRKLQQMHDAGQLTDQDVRRALRAEVTE